jgi:hypothetical protein
VDHPDEGCDKNQSVQCRVPHQVLCVSTYYKPPQSDLWGSVDSFLNVFRYLEVQSNPKFKYLRSNIYDSKHSHKIQGSIGYTSKGTDTKQSISIQEASAVPGAEVHGRSFDLARAGSRSTPVTKYRVRIPVSSTVVSCY